jgi:hypothetical protein
MAGVTDLDEPAGFVAVGDLVVGGARLVDQARDNVAVDDAAREVAVQVLDAVVQLQSQRAPRVVLAVISPISRCT